MGMFDYLGCKMPFPGEEEYRAAGGDGVFQTKSLNRMMDNVLIQEDGHILTSGNYADDEFATDVHMRPEHGHIVFYDYFHGKSWAWRAKVESGKVVLIEKWNKHDQAPA